MRRLSSKSIDVAQVSAFVLALVATLSLPVLAASLEVARVNASAAPPEANAPRLQPNALLTIDQNRATVVDRVVHEWGDALNASNVGLDREQLRAMLTGLRSDHLLAASLAGNLDGLRNVLANALTSAAEGSASLLQAKALGDLADDLVYTPVTPCRLADTRVAGGAIAANTTRNFKVWVSSGGFTAQGGDAGNCNVPADPPAVVLNFAAVNPGGTGNLIAYPTGGALPNTSVLNYQSGTFALSNGAIIPACVPNCTNQLSVKANGPTVDVVIDIVGYFARPKNYGGTHVITGQYATDSGGYGNTASGPSSTVAGGFFNTASGLDSTVGGGDNNTASGIASAVAGGEFNAASGCGSTVAGGYGNTASGSGSFAAGEYAHADQSQCFVFANWLSFPGSNASCLGYPNIARFMLDHGLDVEFYSARMDGGGNRWVYIGDTIAGAAIVAWNGAYLSNAGVWTNASDAASKADFRTVNAREILARVAQMPIRSWRYKIEEPGIRHVGPVAQDFRAAFGLGDDDKHIGTIDAEGVALAAIQGLHQMLKEKERQISHLEAKAAKVDRLERKLQALEAKLGLN